MQLFSFTFLCILANTESHLTTLTIKIVLQSKRNSSCYHLVMNPTTYANSLQNLICFPFLMLLLPKYLLPKYLSYFKLYLDLKKSYDSSTDSFQLFLTQLTLKLTSYIIFTIYTIIRTSMKTKKTLLKFTSFSTTVFFSPPGAHSKSDPVIVLLLFSKGFCNLQLFLSMSLLHHLNIFKVH